MPFRYHNFISRIIRAQITLFRFFLGYDCPIPIIPMRGYMWAELWRSGPCFQYKGDELIWLRKKQKWLSVCSTGTFDTLDDVDKFWEEYDRICFDYPEVMYLEYEPF